MQFWQSFGAWFEKTFPKLTISRMLESQSISRLIPCSFLLRNIYFAVTKLYSTRKINMTTEYIETQTKDGSTIRIEVEPGVKTSTGFGASATTAEATGEAAVTAFQGTLDTVRACANDMIDTLQSLDTPPSNASVEFALKVDAEAGALIAKSGSDIHFKVSLSWKQPESEGEGDKA
jgi:hypothetical protein